MNLVIGTNNQQKAQTVGLVFQQLGIVISSVKILSAASGVAEAPHGKDTYTGARNRALRCREVTKNKNDICIGIESGIVNRYGIYFEEAWAVILCETDEYVGYSSGLVLPKKLLEIMKSKNLTHDKAIKFFDSDAERASNKDTWATYTDNALSRTLSIEEAVRNAAVQSLVHSMSMYH